MARFLFEGVVFAEGDDVVGLESTEEESGSWVVLEEICGDAGFVEVSIAVFTAVTARIITANVNHLDAVAAALLMRVRRQVIVRFAASVCSNDRAATWVALLAGGPFGEIFASEFASEFVRHTFAWSEAILGEVALLETGLDGLVACGGARRKTLTDTTIIFFGKVTKFEEGHILLDIFVDVNKRNDKVVHDAG